MDLYKYLLIILNLVVVSILLHMIWANKSYEYQQSMIPESNLPQKSSDFFLPPHHTNRSSESSGIKKEENEDGSIQNVVKVIRAYHTSATSYDTVQKVLETHTADISKSFANHPSHQVKGDRSLEEYMQFLARRDSCRAKPMYSAPHLQYVI